MPACVACGELGEQCQRCKHRDAPPGTRLYCIEVTLRGSELERHAILVTGLTVQNNGPGLVSVFTSKNGDGTLVHPIAAVSPGSVVDLEDLRLADVWLQGEYGTHVRLAFRGGVEVQDPSASLLTRFERSDVL